MKKALLTKLMLLLCALIAGSSSVWATEQTVTLTVGTYAAAQHPAWENGVAYSSITINSDLTATCVTGGNNGKYYTNNNSWRHYEGNSGAVTITTTSGILKSITFAYANSNNGVLKYGDDSFATGTECTAVSGKTSATFTVKHSSGTSNGNVQITSIKIKYDPAGAVVETCAEPTFSPAAGVYTSAQSVTLSCTTEGATIHYTTDGNAPTTSSPTYNGAISVSATTTIKAIAVKDSYNNSEVASATYAILGHAGTDSDPYTVADARAAIDAGVGMTDVYVSGIVCEGGSSLSSGALNYWISDDGTETNKFEIYKGKGIGGANFTATTDIKLGDEVVVRGNITKFNSTYEFTSGSTLISRQAATNPIIYANDVTIEVDATSGEIAYTIDNPTTASLTAAVSTGDWISNIGYAAGKVTFSATANTGHQRTATITLSYTGAADKVVTVTQKRNVGVASLPLAFDGGAADIETTFGLTQEGLGSDYGSSPKLKFDHTGDYLILRANAAIGTLVFDIKGNGFSSGSTSTFKVQTSTDGTSYSDLATYTALDDTETKVFNLDDDVRYVKWIYTEKGSSSGGNVAIGNINTETVNVTITDADYATFVLATKKVNFGATDVKAYTAKVNGSYVTLTEIKKVPENTPVVVFKDVDAETTVKVPVTGNAIAVAADANDLLVSDGTATTDNSYNVYALANKSNTIGFYKVQAGVTVPAGKAYLKVAANNAPEFLGFNGETTGINEVRGKMEDVSGKVYNLAGQRVAQPTKGLYIVNGKKVVIK